MIRGTIEAYAWSGGRQAVAIPTVMSHSLSLNELWNSARPSERFFQPPQVAALPEAPRRYLEHAIAAGTPLATAVRLRMHGQIRLRSWHPFSAEEVICWQRGFIWQARISFHGITISGGDSLVDGYGAMRWKLLGLVPLMNACGRDIDRSAAGRVNVESIWLPSALCQAGVTWSAAGHRHFEARFSAHGEIAQIDYRTGPDGGLLSVNMPRWGNPDGGKFKYINCGGVVDSEQNFGGYTIPTRMRVGWYFGDSRFEREGEFFRVTIDDAVFR